MSQLTKSTKRFYQVLASGLLLAPVLGILSGYIRQYAIKHDVVLVAVGFAVAFVVRKLGKGITLRFSLASVLITLVAILISDIVTVNGIVGLINPDAYLDFFDVLLRGGDILTVLWVIYRGLTLYIAYVYAKVI